MSQLTLIGTSSVDDWPMYGHDAQNTGYSTSLGPETDYTFLEIEIGDGQVFGAPVVVDEKIYFTELNDGFLYCANAYTGDLIFEKDLGVPILTSSAAVVDGYIYVQTGSGESYGLSCFDVNDVTLPVWSFITGGRMQDSSPTIADGKIYYGDVNKDLYCLDTDGNELWSFPASEKICSTPAVSDGKIYFASGDKWNGPSTIYCLDDTLLGAEIWSYARSTISKSPVFYEDKVYVGSGDTLICLDAQGNGDGTTDLIWSYTIPETTVTSPGVYDNKIYFGTTDNEFYCLNATGNGDLTTDLIWSHQVSYRVEMPPAIADGKVYFNTWHGIYCVDAIGNGNGTTHQYWMDYNFRLVRTQPAIAADSVWMVGDHGSVRGYGVVNNEPPETPGQPSGPTEGIVGIEYTYTTNEVTDTDGDDVEYLFDWGDSGLYSGWLQEVSSSKYWKQAGEYLVRVKARDTSYNQESDWSEALTITVSPGESIPIELQLDINAPLKVNEGGEFDVTISIDAYLIKNAEVNFNNQIKTTDEEGLVTFIAPNVDEHANYIIAANHNDYESISKTISVQNKKESVSQGHIYGVVYDDSEELIPGASVSVILSDTETYNKITSDDGTYVLSIPVGMYTITVSKEGYEDYVILDFEIEKDIAKGLSIELIKIVDYEPAVSSDDTNNLVETTIQTAINNGDVGAKLIIEEDSDAGIQYYSDEFKINIIETKTSEEIISFTVAADDGTTGRYFVMEISNDLISNIESLKVSYDEITEVPKISIEEFLNPEKQESVGYVILSSSNGYYIILYVHHFSEHTITISSVIDVIGMPVAILFFIFISLICTVFFAYPFIIWPKPIRKRKEK